MSKSGDLADLWRTTPPSKDARTPSSRLPEARGASRRTPASRQPSATRAADAGRLPHGGSPGGAIAVSSSSPLPRPTLVILLDSSTASHGSKTSPELIPTSSPSSTDSFPDSPVYKTNAARKAWRASSPSPAMESETSGIAAGARSSRGGVIQDSDDDGGDGSVGDGSASDSAESLLEAARLGQSFSGQAGPWNGAATATTTAAAPLSPLGRSSTPPPMKRRSNAVFASPLPLRRAKKQARATRLPDPPKHKFDMQALLRHAEQEDETEAAARRVSAALAASAAERQPPAAARTAKRHGAAGNVPLLDGFLDDDGKPADLPGGGGGGATESFNKDRLRKAFDRTEAAAGSESWYFFKEYFVPSPIKRRPFPIRTAAAGSRWAFLQDAATRQDFFIMGVVRKALQCCSGGGGGSLSASQKTPREPRLPDELFVWILNEACTEPLAPLRAEYTAVLRCCPEQVRRFVDAERLLLLFQKLGPRWESIDLSTRLELVPTIHRPYPGRDWAPLRSLLHLIAALADSLSLETVACAAKILLRLGIDKVVRETADLLLDYQEAMRRLVTTVPPTDWSEFCYDTGSSLASSVQRPSLRWQVLACLPLDTAACHDFRQRLASVLLFDDPERARQDPRRHLAPGLARLAVRDDFVLTDDTNHADFSALVNLLDAFIDDAGRQAVLHGAGTAHHAPAPAPRVGAGSPVKANAVTAVDFDADVDLLARRLKVIGRGIAAVGGGHVSRLDSKTALERLQIRLTHSVRTRRAGKRSIFARASGAGMGGGGGSAGGSGGNGEGVRPKQQDIRSFFLQKLSKKVVR